MFIESPAHNTKPNPLLTSSNGPSLSLFPRSAEPQFCAASAMDKLVDLARPSDHLSPRSSLTWVDQPFQASHQPPAPQEMKFKILGSPVPSRVDGEMEMETLGPPKPDAVMERKKSRVGICSLC